MANTPRWKQQLADAERRASTQALAVHLLGTADVDAHVYGTDEYGLHYSITARGVTRADEGVIFVRCSGAHHDESVTAHATTAWLGGNRDSIDPKFRALVLKLEEKIRVAQNKAWAPIGG